MLASKQACILVGDVANAALQMGKRNERTTPESTASLREATSKLLTYIANLEEKLETK